MKLKKTIILAWCVIIATLGITITGCRNSSSDKDAGNTTDMNVESSSGMNAESGSDTNAESSSDTNVESSSDTNAESSTDTNAESGTDTNAESSGDMNAENPYVGTWAATVVESSEGEVYDVEEIIGVYEITFNADDTYSGLINDDVFDGKWELTEDGVKVMESNGVSVNFTYKDGELLWEIVMEDIKATYHFVKKQ